MGKHQTIRLRAFPLVAVCGPLGSARRAHVPVRFAMLECCRNHDSFLDRNGRSAGGRRRDSRIGPVRGVLGNCGRPSLVFLLRTPGRGRLLRCRMANSVVPGARRAALRIGLGRLAGMPRGPERPEPDRPADIVPRDLRRVSAPFRGFLRYVLGRTLVPPDSHLSDGARLEPASRSAAHLRPFSRGLRPLLRQRPLVYRAGPLSVLAAHRMGQTGALDGDGRHVSDDTGGPGRISESGAGPLWRSPLWCRSIR